MRNTFILLKTKTFLGYQGDDVMDQMDNILVPPFCFGGEENTFFSFSEEQLRDKYISGYWNLWNIYQHL